MVGICVVCAGDEGNDKKHSDYNGGRRGNAYIMANDMQAVIREPTWDLFIVPLGQLSLVEHMVHVGAVNFARPHGTSEMEWKGSMEGICEAALDVVVRTHR